MTDWIVITRKAFEPVDILKLDVPWNKVKNLQQTQPGRSYDIIPSCCMHWILRPDKDDEASCWRGHGHVRGDFDILIQPEIRRILYRNLRKAIFLLWNPLIIDSNPYFAKDVDNAIIVHIIKNGANWAKIAHQLTNFALKKTKKQILIMSHFLIP